MDETIIGKRILFIILASSGTIYDNFKIKLHNYLKEAKLKGFKVDHFFIYGTNTYLSSYKTPENDLVFSCRDAYPHELIAKTVMSFQHIIKNQLAFDYCIRTNLSTLFHLENLFTFTETLPLSKCYMGINGVCGGVKFVSGAGMILSRDIVVILSRIPEETHCEVADDVTIASLLSQQGIYAEQPLNYSRLDILTENQIVDKNAVLKAIQYRFAGQNRENDTIMMEKVISMLDKL